MKTAILLLSKGDLKLKQPPFNFIFFLRNSIQNEDITVMTCKSSLLLPIIINYNKYCNATIRTKQSYYCQQ